MDVGKCVDPIGTRLRKILSLEALLTVLIPVIGVKEVGLGRKAKWNDSRSY